MRTPALLVSTSSGEDHHSSSSTFLTSSWLQAAVAALSDAFPRNSAMWLASNIPISMKKFADQVVIDITQSMRSPSGICPQSAHACTRIRSKGPLPPYHCLNLTT